MVVVGSVPSWTSSTTASSADSQLQRLRRRRRPPLPPAVGFFRIRTMRIVWKGLGSTTSSSVTTWNSVPSKRIPLKTTSTPSTSTRYDIMFDVILRYTYSRIFLMVKREREADFRVCRI